MGFVNPGPGMLWDLFKSTVRYAFRYMHACVTRPEDVHVLWWCTEAAEHYRRTGDWARAEMWQLRVEFHRKRLGLDK